MEEVKRKILARKAKDDKGLEELRALVRSGTHKLTDANGKEHTLRLLDMGDVVDFESFVKAEAKPPSEIQTTVFMLWLLLRKGGRTDEQLDRGEYEFSQEQAARMFTPVDLASQEVVDAVVGVLKASGWPGVDKLDPRTALPRTAAEGA